MTQYKNISVRKKLLDRMGMSGCNGGEILSDIRICSDHAIEPVILRFKVSVFDANNELKNSTMESAISNLQCTKGRWNQNAGFGIKSIQSRSR